MPTFGRTPPRAQRRRGSRDAHFRSLSPRARLLLCSAIFFTFAGLGPLFFLVRTDVSQDPWWSLPVWSAASGVFALLWAMSFMWRLWLLPVALIVQIVSPPLLGQAIGIPWRFAASEVWLGVVAVGLLVAGYVLSTFFINLEGAARLRAQTELGVARAMHGNLAPPIDRRVRGLHILGRSDPSETMGGDLLDVVEEPGAGGVDVYLADVSGHGVRAGILMAMVKSAIRMRLLASRAPAADAGVDALVTDLNAVVAQVKDEGMFVTFACLRFAPADDGSPRAVRVALAGHLPVLVWRAATGAVEELPNGHFPLGVVDDERFSSDAAAAHPGDLFVLYTDGLIEVADRAGRQFGLERFRALIAGAAHLPLPQILDAVLAQARRHGRQIDDQSLLLVRVVGEAA